MAITTTVTTTHEPFLSLPFRPGENWLITNLFNDPGFHYCYTSQLKGSEGINWRC